MKVFGPFMKNASTGAYNQLWAATADKVELKSGCYYTPVAALTKPSGYGQDDKMAEALWEWTENELDSKGY